MIVQYDAYYDTVFEADGVTFDMPFSRNGEGYGDGMLCACGCGLFESRGDGDGFSEWYWRASLEALE